MAAILNTSVDELDCEFAPKILCANVKIYVKRLVAITVKNLQIKIIFTIPM